MRTLFHESIICLLPFHSPQYPSLPSLFIMLNLTMNLIIWENYNLQVEPEDTKYIQIFHIWLLKYISTWRNKKNPGKVETDVSRSGASEKVKEPFSD